MPLYAQAEQIVFGALTCQHDCVERKAFDTRVEPRGLLVVQTIDAHILVVYGNLWEKRGALITDLRQIRISSHNYSPLWDRYWAKHRRAPPACAPAGHSACATWSTSAAPAPPARPSSWAARSARAPWSDGREDRSATGSPRRSSCRPLGRPRSGPVDRLHCRCCCHYRMLSLRRRGAASWAADPRPLRPLPRPWATPCPGTCPCGSGAGNQWVRDRLAQPHSARSRATCSAETADGESLREENQIQRLVASWFRAVAVIGFN